MGPVPEGRTREGVFAKPATMCSSSEGATDRMPTTLDIGTSCAALHTQYMRTRRMMATPDDLIANFEAECHGASACCVVVCMLCVLCVLCVVCLFVCACSRAVQLRIDDVVVLSLCSSHQLFGCLVFALEVLDLRGAACSITLCVGGLG